MGMSNKHVGVPNHFKIVSNKRVKVSNHSAVVSNKPIDAATTCLDYPSKNQRKNRLSMMIDRRFF